MVLGWRCIFEKMKSTCEEINIIAKSLAGILKTVDKTVLWTDYFNLKEKQIIAIGFTNGKIKYSDVTGKNPFKTAIFVMKCMEEIAFDSQFMTEKQLLPYIEEINDALEKRDEIYDKLVLSIKKREISCYELAVIVEWGQQNGDFPEFVANIKNNPLLASGAFEQVLHSKEITTYDMFQFEKKFDELFACKKQDNAFENTIER